MHPPRARTHTAILTCVARAWHVHRCWAIFLTNVIAGELLPSLGLLIAIATGVVCGLVGFAAHYARKSGGGLGATPIISGEEHCSTAIRSAAQVSACVITGWHADEALLDGHPIGRAGECMRHYLMAC